MKIKKVLLMFSMLCSLGAVSAPILTNNQQVNNDTIIVNNEKVNLRQKAIKKANDTSNSANIETTNVDYDLRYLFGGEENYLSYNIWDLLPTTNDSKVTSFKFICAKPVGTNLYLYVYHNDNRNSDILSASFKISKSKTQNSETGEFEEQFSIYNARFINSYGYKQRFMKFAIDNVINTSEDVRCYIENGYITYQDTSTTKKYYSKTYDIRDEFAFGLNNGDYMYEYFKDDYVKITDHDMKMHIEENNPQWNIDNLYQRANETTYYFFSSDHDIEDLIEVQYDYQYITYEATMDFKDSKNNYPSGKENWGQVYTGLLNGVSQDTSGHHNNAKSIEEIETKTYFNQSVKSESYSVSVTKPSFLWWTQEVKYEMQNIQDCLDLSNLKNEEQQAFKSFIEIVQNERVANGKDKFQWCFKVRSDERYARYSWTEAPWYSYFILGLGGCTNYSISVCHEVKQAMTTWLKFRTNNQEFEFNTLDVPIDTSGIVLNTVPFDTLGDVIVENALNMWEWLKGTFNNIFDNLVPLLMSLAVILVVVACWPILTSFTKALGMAIEQTTKKKKKPKKKGG